MLLSWYHYNCTLTRARGHGSGQDWDAPLRWWEKPCPRYFGIFPLYQSVLVKQELSLCKKFSVYRLIYLPIPPIWECDQNKSTGGGTRHCEDNLGEPLRWFWHLTKILYQARQTGWSPWDIPRTHSKRLYFTVDLETSGDPSGGAGICGCRYRTPDWPSQLVAMVTLSQRSDRQMNEQNTFIKYY